MSITLTRQTDGTTIVQMETAEELTAALSIMNGHAHGIVQTPVKKQQRKKVKVSHVKRNGGWKAPSDEVFNSIRAKLPLLKTLDWDSIDKAGKKIKWDGDRRTLRNLLARKKAADASLV